MLPSLIKRQFHFMVIIGLGIVFIFLWSYPYQESARWSRDYQNNHIIFNSPDETASYFFIKYWASEGSVRVPEPLNTAESHVVAPRSVVAENSALIPVAFPGMIWLYGAVVKVVGSASVLYLTPVMNFVALLFFYSLVEKLFSQRVGFFASLLFLLHPIVWYFASRGLLPNVLFCDLLIIAASLLASACFGLEKMTLSSGKISTFFLVSGLVFGGAFLVRPVEFVWVLPVLAYALYRARNNVRRTQLFLLCIPMLLSAAMLLTYNQNTYGSWFQTGYGEVLLSSDAQVGVNAALSFASRIIAPFGLHPRLVAHNVFDYWVRFTWWYLAPLTIMLVWIAHDRFGRKRGSLPGVHFAYAAIFVLVSFFLFQYYGSWQLYDNINPWEKTIGTSYLRYWLPVSFMALPLVALCVVEVLKKISSRFFRGGLQVIFFAIFLFLSVQVVYEKSEGVKEVQSSIHSYYEVEKRVSGEVEPYAVLVADRADKVFWPQHKVVSYLGNDRIFPGIRALLDGNQKVYYYLHTRLDEDVAHEMEEKISLVGLTLREYKSFPDGDFLYEFKKR